MPATPQPANRIALYVAVLLIVPFGLFVGWAVDELTGWHPRPPRPAYRAATPLPPAEPVVVAESKAAKPAERVHYYSEWTSFEAAMTESKRTGKPVMIDFSADWCGPCRRLKSEVFDEDALARQVQNAVIPVSIVDRVSERGFNTEDTKYLQDRFDADAFPTLIVVSARTGLMTRTQGFWGPEQTVAWIRESAQLVR